MVLIHIPNVSGTKVTITIEVNPSAEHIAMPECLLLNSNSIKLVIPYFLICCFNGISLIPAFGCSIPPFFLLFKLFRSENYYFFSLCILQDKHFFKMIFFLYSYCNEDAKVDYCVHLDVINYYIRPFSEVQTEVEELKNPICNTEDESAVKWIIITDTWDIYIYFLKIHQV